MAKKPVTFTLNGSERAAFADDGQNLLEFLRLVRHQEVIDLIEIFTVL